MIVVVQILTIRRFARAFLISFVVSSVGLVGVPLLSWRAKKNDGRAGNQFRAVVRQRSPG
jgi:hypothetical protein